MMRGQGFDGAAAMAGRYNGVQAVIKSKIPLAHFVHCVCHRFNLSVAYSCDLPPVRTCLTVLSKAHNFFSSAKRKHELEKQLNVINGDKGPNTIKSVCMTRWVEKYVAIDDFCELLPAIIPALEEIEKWRDQDTADNATALKTL